MWTLPRSWGFNAKEPKASLCLARFFPSLLCCLQFSLSTLFLLIVLPLTQIWFPWNKAVFLPPNTFFVRADKFTKLSTSQTCNFSVALVLTLLLPLHLGSPTCFGFFSFLVLNPSFSLTLWSQSPWSVFLLFIFHPSLFWNLAYILLKLTSPIILTMWTSTSLESFLICLLLQR